MTKGVMSVATRPAYDGCLMTLRILERLRRLLGGGAAPAASRELVERLLAPALDITAMSEAELRAAALALRARAREGAGPAELVVDTFRIAREASRRVLGLAPFDVQILGAARLFEGGIIEMATGEGKTLVAVFPAIVHALAGEGVHILTVNDYLAGRDARWMLPLYELFGLTVSAIHQR